MRVYVIQYGCSRIQNEGHRHDGPIVVSNQATERITDLYLDNGYTVTRRSAPRFISANGDRSRAVEIIATKNI